MYRLSRSWPSADLAPFVEHYWIVRWDLSEPRTAETVPHPSIHMVLESPGRSEIVGVMRTRFSRVLEGRGRVVGTKFRPGGFRPFVKERIAALTGRRPSLDDVFGGQSEGLAEQVMGQADDLEGIAIIESFLRSFRPSPDDAMALAAAWQCASRTIGASRGSISSSASFIRACGSSNGCSASTSA